MSITQWSALQLQQNLQDNPGLLLLDVRQPNEFAYARIEGSVLIPLAELPERFKQLNPEQEIAVLCHHGMRSQQACQFLQYQGFDRLYNVSGGIDAWSMICDPLVPRY